MSWYYAIDGAQQGPVSEHDFQRLISSGQIKTDTLVWREGMPDWKPHGEIVAAARPSAAAAIPRVADDVGVCAECGGTFPRQDMVAYESALVCGGCRDVFFQKIREGVRPHAAMHYAGFWIRFVAKFIDGIILAVVNTVFTLIAGVMTSAMAQGAASPDAAIILVQLVLFVVQMAVGIGYAVFFVGRFGATPGKMALSLKIVRPDGSPVTYGRALGRAFAEYLSSLIFAIGYIMAAFDEEKRTLHDRICDTRVIRT